MVIKKLLNSFVSSRYIPIPCPIPLLFIPSPAPSAPLRIPPHSSLPPPSSVSLFVGCVSPEKWRKTADMHSKNHTYPHFTLPQIYNFFINQTYRMLFFRFFFAKTSKRRKSRPLVTPQFLLFFRVPILRIFGISSPKEVIIFYILLFFLKFIAGQRKYAS